MLNFSPKLFSLVFRSGQLLTQPRNYGSFAQTQLLDTVFSGLITVVPRLVRSLVMLTDDMFTSGIQNSQGNRKDSPDLQTF